MSEKRNKINKKYSRVYPETNGDDVVISGMAGKFPNCHNIAEYKHNLYNKIDMVDDDERRWRHFNPEIPKRSGKIYDLSKFDATFFGVHFKQCHTMDPQTRIIMETAYEAVLDAGINPKSLRGSKTGVYIGSCISESEKTWFYEKVPSGGFGITGCSRAMLANRISYTLGLQGPSFLLDTACSSSMYALDNAFTAIRNGEIDAAIIGGSNLSLHPYVTLQFARLGVLAPDGFCRPFDKNATGYTRAEAINCVFLQRRRDALRIYASVVYSKTNCDGHKPEGITYPSGKQQEQLLEDFYEEVDVTPNDLGYLEAHSTGTIVGDPEECRAVDNALCKKRSSPLLVGSVKSNVGHAEAASGVCSIAKACFAFETGLIAPNINFNEIRSDIAALVEGRLVVVKDVMKLEKPYIGISSFGFGGANAHALLKQHEKIKINKGIPHDDIPRLLVWAGRTEEAVNVIIDVFEKEPLDVEYIGLLHNIQKHEVTGMVFRGYGVLGKKDEESSTIYARDVQHYSGIKRPVVWVFSGMGSQWLEMGTSLMILPQFYNSIKRCHDVLASEGLNLIQILTSSDPLTFENILHSFVGIAAIQIGIVDVLRSLNLEPDHIIGHSVGELGCGYADGGLTLEQMILAAYYRGRVSLEVEKIRGSMAAIGIGYKKIMRLVPPSIDVACHNSIDSCTISGPAEDVKKFVSELKAKGVFAKEVLCSNIAYHSRYIAHMGPKLLEYLKKVIPEPKLRSSKWISSSVPQTEWQHPSKNLCSAEYHTNNLLSSVLFEEACDLLPKNALTIEIAPHGLLQAILKRSMPNGIHIPLTQRGNKNNVIHFITAIGKLFTHGITFPVENLYPKIEFPVSRGTGNISSLMRWDHSEDWFVTKYENMKTKASGERVFNINLGSDDEEFLSGHIIDGKVLVPATNYLCYVWQTFSLMYYGPSYMDVPIEFQEVKFLRATNVTAKNTVELNVMIQYGTGHFEITENGSLLVVGTIKEIEHPTVPKVYEFVEKCDFPMLSKADFYKELRLRGYHYNGEFQAIEAARGDGLFGKIKWNYNWVTFMDAMMQTFIIGTDSRTLLLPTRIRKLRIYGLHHFDLMTKMDQNNRVFDVYVDRKYDRIVSGGIEMEGLHASPVQRRRPPGAPVLESYQFVSHIPSCVMNVTDAVRVCVQLYLENTPVLKVKVVEVDVNDNCVPIIPSVINAIEDLPLVAGDYILYSSQTFEDLPSCVQVENAKTITQTNSHFCIMEKIEGNFDNVLIDQARKCLNENGYLIIRESCELNVNNLQLPEDFKLIAVIPLDKDKEMFIVLKYGSSKKNICEPVVIECSETDQEYEWVTKVQKAINDKTPVIMYAYNETFSGVVGMVNCLRKEPDGDLVSCYYINDNTAPIFNINDQFYANQRDKGLCINIYQNGKWGSYRHLKLNTEVESLERDDHIYGNVLVRGDLSSLRWFEGPLKPEDCDIKIAYSSVNFRDIMLATGRLAVELYGGNRIDQSCVLGFEYSGYHNKTGKRIMSMVVKGGVASYVEKPSKLIWTVPDHWSLKEAATVPVVYITVYYAFFMVSDIRKGKTILIHAGTGGIGLAAIRTALAYNLEVFTTCSSQEKKQFLLSTFPQLKENHIGNSRDTSFEKMIIHETNGKGVDFVLNSLSEDKLLASVRCLGTCGQFLEIGKFDMANDTKLGMGCFLKEIKFKAVLADRLLHATDEEIAHLKKLIDDDIASGIIQPLPATVFQAYEIEQAFRHMVGGKHMGKVLIQVRENPKSKFTIPLKVIKQVYFKPELSYIIPGGLGGFGLELADWLALRGAKHIILSSRKGLTKDYQSYRIALWKTYGCQTLISTNDITTASGCHKLIDEANNLAPVGGIFNLAVALNDGIFLNQTKEKFVDTLAPKAVATKLLDEISRQKCPKLEHFVVFSSVSCGRGNAGQTNYGMANSIMERIIQDRHRKGFPAKAIQWGAVGEVGLVADMAENKIDVEIGGTLQQRISSCLQELDVLLTNINPVVGSMVVAEKRSRSGNQTIIEAVMHIMGLRDLKSVSLSTTLAEMGMDSLMAIEIKQTLEREYELILTPEDLRALTFQKLQEYSESLQGTSNNAAVLTFTTDGETQGMNILIRNLGDETYCNELLIDLETKADTKNRNIPPTIIIPGIEGTAGLAWYKLAKNIVNKMKLLQLYRFSECTTAKQLGEACFSEITPVLKTGEPFYIVAYSFGSYVALEIVRMLEKAGFYGQLVLIDGAPHFLTKLARLAIGEEFTENELYDHIISGIVNKIYPQETKESLTLAFSKLPTIEDKIQKFMSYAYKQNIYSPEYCKTMLKALLERIKLTAKYDLENIEKFKTPITLVRPTEVALQDIEDDYCLQLYTDGEVILKVIEGNHSSILDNPALTEIINDFHPSLKDDKKFMADFISDTKTLKPNY